MAVPKIRLKGFDADWEKSNFGNFGSVAMCKRIFKDQTSPIGDIPFFKIGTFGLKPDAYITRELYDEYKSKTSYVINVDNSTKDTNENEYYNITLDSVLSGHEDAVSSVQWCKLADSSPSTYVILSSSFDFTVAIWKYDNKHNIWNKEHTLGEMLGNAHAFFYATFLDSSNEILAYAYNGALYL
jgi:WD40 repeat protein